MQQALQRLWAVDACQSRSERGPEARMGIQFPEAEEACRCWLELFMRSRAVSEELVRFWLSSECGNLEEGSQAMRIGAISVRARSC